MNNSLTEKQEATIATWVDTLNSGAIKQAHAFLETDGGAMCCLGVLMQCQGKRPWTFYDGRLSELQTSVVPFEYASGLSSAVMRVLAHLNDGTMMEIPYNKCLNKGSKPHSFKEIAAIIPRIKNCLTYEEIAEAIPELIHDGQ